MGVVQIRQQNVHSIMCRDMASLGRSGTLDTAARAGAWGTTLLALCSTFVAGLAFKTLPLGASGTAVYSYIPAQALPGSSMSMLLLLLQGPRPQRRRRRRHRSPSFWRSRALAAA